MMSEIDEFMGQAVSEGVFPGSTLMVSHGGLIVYHKSHGFVEKGSGSAVTTDTVFDLASLTKPLVTVPAIMQLVKNGKLSLDTKIGNIFELFSGKDKKAVTIADLLVHSSGLPAHKPYYNILKKISEEDRLSAFRHKVLSEPLETPRGEKIVYSDIGFIILGWIVEAISGVSLNRFIVENVYKPLGIRELFFPVDKKKNEIEYASTEKCPWRGKTMVGEVHDDNAWVVGGVCGHAGLFGTASGMSKLLDEYMNVFLDREHNDLFNTVLLKMFLREYKNTGRTLGFDMPSAVSSSGNLFSKNAVGHLGYTGTSFWMDFEKNIIIILLTNRVNPSRNNIKIRKFRPKIHNCIMQLLQKEKQKDLWVD